MPWLRGRHPGHDVGMELTRAAGALLTPAGRAEPYPYYARLRDAPVLASDGWAVVSGYAECARALRDPRLRAEDGEWLDQVAPDWRTNEAQVALEASMLFANSPRHEGVRRLVSRVFTPRRVADLRDSVERLAGDLTDHLAKLAAGGEPVDFMAEFAYPLPVTVIGALLGVPEADWPGFCQDAADFSMAFELAATGEQLVAANAATVRLQAYFARLVAAKRAEPAANLVLLLFAGFETTTNLLGNGLRLLLDRPEHAARLRDDPGLAAAYVEEVLRYESPVQLTSRWNPDDLELGGVTVPARSEVLILLASANRDPRRFVDPDVFHPDRPDNQPLSFGGGPHFCLGSALARQEAQVAFPMLLRRLTGLRLAGEPVRRDRMILRGYQHLPVAVH